MSANTNHKNEIIVVTRNKKAFHDYDVQAKVEAGIELLGTEVKSLRAGKAKITEGHISIDANLEAWIHSMSIPQYSFGNWTNHTEDRKRKLLLHKHQIKELKQKIKVDGMTLIPLSLYFKNSKVKLEIGLARGKKNYDKRQDEIKKEAEKNIREFIRH